MAETLLSPSGILLYGRVMMDLRLAFKEPSREIPAAQGSAKKTAKDANPGDETPRLGGNKFLQKQLAAEGAQIARIYGFSYEGHYYDLARPPLFVVHGPGIPADTPVPGSPRSAKAPDITDKFGVAATAKSFPEDMRVWAYDKSDYSLRMDVQTGPLEQILLEAELSSDMLKTYFGGAHVRLRRSPAGDTGD